MRKSAQSHWGEKQEIQAATLFISVPSPFLYWNAEVGSVALERETRNSSGHTLHKRTLAVSLLECGSRLSRIGERNKKFKRPHSLSVPSPLLYWNAEVGSVALRRETRNSSGHTLLSVPSPLLYWNAEVGSVALGRETRNSSGHTLSRIGEAYPRRFFIGTRKSAQSHWGEKQKIQAATLFISVTSPFLYWNAEVGSVALERKEETRNSSGHTLLSVPSPLLYWSEEVGSVALEREEETRNSSGHTLF